MRGKKMAQILANITNVCFVAPVSSPSKTFDHSFEWSNDAEQVFDVENKDFFERNSALSRHNAPMKTVVFQGCFLLKR
jgi:hypothetical protein